MVLNKKSARAYFRFKIFDPPKSIDMKVVANHPIYGIIGDTYEFVGEGETGTYVYYDITSDAEKPDNLNELILHYPEIPDIFCVPELPYGTISGLIGMLASAIGLFFKRQVS